MDKEKNKELLGIFFSLIGVPSFLAIFGLILVIWGLSEGSFIAFILGVVWIIVDYLIFYNQIKEFIEEIQKK